MHVRQQAAQAATGKAISVDPIGTAVLDWHDFFTAVTAMAGTLIGLLFVVIGLNPFIMADTGHAGMRVLAGQTFHSFLVLVLIGSRR
jgi:presenilin-like A22 family membrane protease